MVHRELELSGREVLGLFGQMPLPIANIYLFMHRPPRILIFSQVSDQRDGAIVLERLATALSGVQIDHAIFTLYDPKQNYDSTTGANISNFSQCCDFIY